MDNRTESRMIPEKSRHKRFRWIRWLISIPVLGLFIAAFISIIALLALVASIMIFLYILQVLGFWEFIFSIFILFLLLCCFNTRFAKFVQKMMQTKVVRAMPKLLFWCAVAVIGAAICILVLAGVFSFIGGLSATTIIIILLILIWLK